MVKTVASGTPFEKSAYGSAFCEAYIIIAKLEVAKNVWNQNLTNLASGAGDLCYLKSKFSDSEQVKRSHVHSVLIKVCGTLCYIAIIIQALLLKLIHAIEK